MSSLSLDESGPGPTVSLKNLKTFIRSTALPECHKEGIADSNGVAPSCTWLGELVLE
jgi:hypothetical protein